MIRIRIRTGSAEQDPDPDEQNGADKVMKNNEILFSSDTIVEGPSSSFLRYDNVRMSPMIESTLVNKH